MQHKVTLTSSPSSEQSSPPADDAGLLQYLSCSLVPNPHVAELHSDRPPSMANKLNTRKKLWLRNVRIWKIIHTD